MMVKGTTKNLGIIGCPVEHSLSPILQNAALQDKGLDYIYIAMPVKPESLSTAFAGMKEIGFVGFNITIPHKIAIMELLDSVDAGAKMIGAVNTVVNENGVWTGYNTDSMGFISSLKNNGVVMHDKQAVILGAGGAARAVIWGLLEEGVSKLTLVVRDREKTMPMAQHFSQRIEVEVIEWQSTELKTVLNECDILVNTTPLGMAPKVDVMPAIDMATLKNGAVVCDAIYTPIKTKFLAEAEKLGHKIINGEGMLVGQGAAAFEKWTGITPSEAVMTKALHEALLKK